MKTILLVFAMLCIAPMCTNAQNAALPYIGEIRLFAGDFTQRNWAVCDGRLISINENRELFQLLGNRYGGDGTTTFALPNLVGATTVGVSSSRSQASVIQGKKVLVDGTQKTQTIRTVAMRYMICLNGAYPFE